jgi:predicted metalloprotease with PDZ domain
MAFVVATSTAVRHYRSTNFAYAGIIARRLRIPALHLGLGVRDEQDRAIISTLTPNSPAVQAGLDVGDKLIAVNNEEVTFENWQDLLHKYKPGTAITLLISRRGQVKSITATLGKQPAFDYALSINDDAADEATQLREKWWKSSASQK